MSTSPDTKNNRSRFNRWFKSTSGYKQTRDEKMKIKTKKDHICYQQIMIAVIRQMLRELNQSQSNGVK
jgi:hypothetical protein